LFTNLLCQGVLTVCICNEKYTVITDGIEELPFWENGVKFFMIKGPNEERIEFCQKL